MKFNKRASILLASSLMLGSYSLQASSEFNLECGGASVITKGIFFKNNTLSYESNGSLSALPIAEGQVCTVKGLSVSNIGVFCNSANNFVVSDSYFNNGSPFQTQYKTYRLVVSANAGVTRSELKIKKSSPSLIFTSIQGLNSGFKPHTTSLLVNANDRSANCEVLPFSYDGDGTGC